MTVYLSLYIQNTHGHTVLKFFKCQKMNKKWTFSSIPFSVFSYGNTLHGSAVNPFLTYFCLWRASHLYFMVKYPSNTHSHFWPIIIMFWVSFNLKKSISVYFIHENVKWERVASLKCYIINTFSFSLHFLKDIQFSVNKKNSHIY